MRSRKLSGGLLDRSCSRWRTCSEPANQDSQANSVDLFEHLPKLQVEYLDIGQLRPSPHNARIHSDRQIRQIERSIEQYGFTNPALVDEANVIMAGHGRVKAAERNGLSHIPVIRIADLSEAQKRAYIIADNELAAKAGWDKEILAIELQGLIDLKFDLELTGFEIPEMKMVEEPQTRQRARRRIHPPLLREAASSASLAIYGSSANTFSSAETPADRLLCNTLGRQPRSACVCRSSIQHANPWSRLRQRPRQTWQVCQGQW